MTVKAKNSFAKRRVLFCAKEHVFILREKCCSFSKSFLSYFREHFLLCEKHWGHGGKRKIKV